MSRPKVHVHRPGGIVGVQKIMAMNSVKKYCIENNLSVDKLGGMIYDVSDNVAMFMAPSEIKANGLTADIASQPRLVLAIEDHNGTLRIRPTEHTFKYLAK